MKKILLIEDDDTLRLNIAEFLEEEGFIVYTAFDGLFGIHKSTELLPDIILCDITMPKADGYEVYKAINSIPETSSIPFIFISAKTQKEDISYGMQLGADAYITKPFFLNDLLNCIRAKLKKSEKSYLQNKLS